MTADRLLLLPLLTLATGGLLTACGDKDEEDDGDGSESVCYDDDLGSEIGQPVAEAPVDGDDFDEGDCNGEEIGTDGEDWGWTWTAPATAGYSINTFGSGFDTVLYILDGDCNGTILACNDDADFDNTESQTYIELQEGQQVVIVVDSQDAYSSGTAALQILQDL